MPWGSWRRHNSISRKTTHGTRSSNGHKIDGFFGEKYESGLSWGRFCFGFSWMIGLELRESDQIEERYVAISNHQIITKSRAIAPFLWIPATASYGHRPCYPVTRSWHLLLLSSCSGIPSFYLRGCHPKNGWNMDSSQNFKLRQEVWFFKSWKMHFFKQYRRFEQIHQCLEKNIQVTVWCQRLEVKGWFDLKMQIFIGMYFFGTTIFI